MSLAVSEPYAGSDVANLRTTAVLQGDHFVVNGEKKWITGGCKADFFTVAVRTGGPGFDGGRALEVELAKLVGQDEVKEALRALRRALALDKMRIHSEVFRTK